MPECFMRGCDCPAAAGDACSLHATPEQLRPALNGALAEVKRARGELRIAEDHWRAQRDAAAARGDRLHAALTTIRAYSMSNLLADIAIHGGPVSDWEAVDRAAREALDPAPAPKHDEDCRRRHDHLPKSLCSCGLTDEQVAALTAERERGRG